MKEYSIDASGKKLGRVASEAALFLRGKSTADFNPRVNPEVKVTIKNILKMDILEKKRNEKEYVSYTGYPGGLKKSKLAARITKEGLQGPLRDAIKGMIPSTKLRPKIMKNLVIEA